jgi:Domain of unknown function (DUF4129)
MIDTRWHAAPSGGEMSQIPRPAATLWARALGLLAVVGMLGLLIVALLAVMHPGHSGHLLAAAEPPVPVGPRPSGHAVDGKTGDAAPLIAALALATLAVMALWWSRNHRATPAEDPGLCALAAVVAAGTEALDTSGSGRDALIACCAAMDRALYAGSPGDTPEELLRWAAQAGLIGGPVAGRLASLLREARFSGHDLAEAPRQSARAALEEISATLARLP